MRPEVLDLLRCPQTGETLLLQDAEYENGAVRSGRLVSSQSGISYAIRDFIPRFLSNAKYSDDFSLQWNEFQKTQLDSHSGHPISATRFWAATGWRKEDLAGSWVLDLGCGSGRFSEIALQAGANVLAVDCSTAVDVCYANLKDYPNLTVVQGDLYQLPIRRETFDYAYALGVLQHTPDVSTAFAALPPMLAPGGHLCVDVYERSWKNIMRPKYWLRPVTTRMPKPALLSLISRVVPNMLSVSRAVGSIPLFGPYLKPLVPVANYFGTLPLNDEQQLEWAVLDTFDWLSPQFDNPQNSDMIRGFFEDAGMKDIEILKAGHLVGRASKPAAL